MTRQEAGRHGRVLPPPTKQLRRLSPPPGHPRRNENRRKRHRLPTGPWSRKSRFRSVSTSEATRGIGPLKWRRATKERPSHAQTHAPAGPSRRIESVRAALLAELPKKIAVLQLEKG